MSNQLALEDETGFQQAESQMSQEKHQEQADQVLLNSAGQETDKTDETDCPSNVEFLTGIFGAEEMESRPMVVSFMGNPQTVPKSNWYGHAWDPSVSSPQASHNNYFSLATFRPDEAGLYRRKKKQFVALLAVMLDDVGTKVAAGRIILPPSWRIETSPGNYQVGFILAEPLTESVTADRLMKGIINARLCDPGADGPTSRLARLPVAVNGKHVPPFACRMTEWQPNRRYTMQQLVDGLELEIRQSSRDKQTATLRHAASADDSDAVSIPRPAENAVIAALRFRRLYKQPLGSGRHDITCPWVAEHTDGIDGGTAYFEPSDLWPVGGFHCLHGHCQQRRMRDLLQFLGVEARAARMKATIRVRAGEIHRVVDAAEKELALTGRHYQRGGLIVTVITDPGTKETRVQEVNQPSLVQALAGAADWIKHDRRNDEWFAIDPPPRHVSVLFDSASYIYLPILNGLARQPYFREDITLMTTPGYDTVSGMFGLFAEQGFIIPKTPGREQAQAALDTLINLLTEFSFKSAMDCTAALAAMLTAAVRSSLPNAPMIHVKAHQVGSGKSYLCRLITAFATPKPGTPSTFPKEDEECRKLLLAELLRAPAVIEFDNLTSDLLAHKSLCTVLTSEHMTDRILGVSKTATVGTRTLFLSSGNNVGPVQDMTRRCMTIQLDPACETPATRTFQRPDLVQQVLADRGRYVSAALTIILAWFLAGRPRTACPPLAGFDLWSDYCRQPLLWLGCADSVQSVLDAIGDDPDRQLLEQLLIAWDACFGQRPTMVRDAIKFIHGSFSSERDELQEILQDIAGERDGINRRRLGWWIKRHAGRIVGGRRFTRASGSRSAEAWQVESVSSVL